MEVKEEDAYDYAQIGCNETEIPGRMIGGSIPRTVIMTKILELALSGGISKYTKKQVGPVTKALGEYDTFDDFLESFKTQYAYFLKWVPISANIVDNLHADLRPLPFASSLMSGTIERGRGIMTETDYFFWTLGMNDLVNISNSFAAINKTVFKDKSVTQESLKAALEVNYEGYEHIRKLMLDAPKFGNDDDEADEYITVIEEMAFELVKDV